MLYSPTGKTSIVTLASPLTTVALYVVPFTVMLTLPPLGTPETLTVTVAFV